MMFHFSTASLEALAKCHPHLQQIAQIAIQTVDFKVLDSTRGKDAQERAFREGHSKVHFGNSAHNYVPAIAFDLFPAPYDWDNQPAFIALSKAVFAAADKVGVKLRWGGDRNMDGDIRDGWDMPHFELHPWRHWAETESKPYTD